MQMCILKHPYSFTRRYWSLQHETCSFCIFILQEESREAESRVSAKTAAAKARVKQPAPAPSKGPCRRLGQRPGAAPAGQVAGESAEEPAGQGAVPHCQQQQQTATSDPPAKAPSELLEGRGLPSADLAPPSSRGEADSGTSEAAAAPCLFPPVDLAHAELQPTAALTAASSVSPAGAGGMPRLVPLAPPPQPPQQQPQRHAPGRMSRVATPSSGAGGTGGHRGSGTGGLAGQGSGTGGAGGPRGVGVVRQGGQGRGAGGTGEPQVSGAQSLLGGKKKSALGVPPAYPPPPPCQAPRGDRGRIPAASNVPHTSPSAPAYRTLRDASAAALSPTAASSVSPPPPPPPLFPRSVPLAQLTQPAMSPRKMTGVVNTSVPPVTASQAPAASTESMERRVAALYASPADEAERAAAVADESVDVAGNRWPAAAAVAAALALALECRGVSCSFAYPMAALPEDLDLDWSCYQVRTGIILPLVWDTKWSTYVCMPYVVPTVFCLVRMNL